MKKIVCSILLLIFPFFMNGQGIFFNGIVSATLSPIVGTSDLELVIQSQCTEIHHFNNYTYNSQANIVTLCYQNTGLTMPSVRYSTITLPNANLNGSQLLTINSYYFFGPPTGNCNSNPVFNQPITLAFNGPLTQPRIFTLNNDSFETKKISLYPNPNNGKFSIDLPSKMSNVALSIYDLSGKKIYDIANYSSGTTMLLNDLAKGLYLAKVSTDQTSKTLKFIVH